MIEAGISSSYHIASFFGLTDRVHQPSEAVKPAASASTTIAVAPPAFAPPAAPELNPIPWPVAVSPSYAKSHRPPRRPAIDVGAVITRALTAAGLMK
jgi:hypothetical protein